jgi:hypothetical protein
MMTKAQRFLGEFLEGVGVYVMTLLGILMAQYGPILMRPADTDLTLQWVRIGASAALALAIVVQDERGGDEEGKRANLKRRLSHAFTHGVTWNVIAGIGVQAIQAAG